MRRLRHAQPNLWEGVLAQEVADLWEPWMRQVDAILKGDELLTAVFEAQGRRRPESHRRGRRQTPAEVVLRMLILKHVRNWSYETLVREVRANLVYRSFCRIGLEEVPDDKTMVRLGQAVGPEVIAELHERIVALAREKGITRGRKMHVDTTVVETNIHYPTDSSLLGDGTRVLTRLMKRAKWAKRGGLKSKVGDRMRSVKKRVIEISLASAAEGAGRRGAEKGGIPAAFVPREKGRQPSEAGSRRDSGHAEKETGERTRSSLSMVNQWGGWRPHCRSASQFGDRL